ncbi:flagellar hook-basal body complex protein [Nitrospirillum sp. BR 11163]|uniref:flagellar hook-basal body complex protein n=1 Tax=Nitrospirillum sp. BR 11163 TaxID=3104323 RepID=UPI002B000797|nr:flagellar hook-basal body complex protein [Nitrospirillum sp. BR 11163]MEA1675098.1 flagellar hook-basal body complex protein [Nitrospirillum sp. BR 11163]
MSIFGSMSVGISGLQAQSTALSNISDNIANAQTTGFKRIDTSFESLVISASNTQYQAGGVQARPDYVNSVSGTVSSSDTPTNIAIRGNGFFSVSKLTTVNGQTTTSGERYYTRDGSFALDSTRTLVNNSGFALNGFAYNSTTGLFDTSATPVQVTSDIDSPVPTKEIDVKANLPTDPSGSITPTQVQVYDAAGTAHNVNLTWRQGATAGTWQLGITADGSQGTASAMPVEGLLSTGFPATSSESSLTANTLDRGQVQDVSFSTAAVSPLTGFNIGDVYSVVVNGTTYSTTLTSGNASSFSSMKDVAQSLADKINGSDTSSGVTATVSPTGALRLTSRTAGTSFSAVPSVSKGAITNHTIGTMSTIVSGNVATNVKGIVSQTAVGDSTNIDDVYTATVTGTDNTGNPIGPVTVSVTITPQNIGTLNNLSNVMSKLAYLINNDTSTSPSLKGNVAAAASGGTLTLTSSNSGPVTLAMTATDSPNLLNTANSSTYIANHTGSKETEKLTITGQPGDVGTTYTYTIAPPLAQTATVTTSTPAGTPAPDPTQQTTYAYDFTNGNPSITATTPTSIGQLYTVTLGSTTYNYQITAANITQTPDLQSVVAELASQIAGDSGSNFTLDPANPPTGTSLNLISKDLGATLSTTQVTPPGKAINVTYKTDGTEASLSDISGKIAALINTQASQQGLGVQALSSGGTITLTGNTDSDSFFTTVAPVIAGKTPGHINLSFGGTLADGTQAAAGTLSHMDSTAVGSGNATVTADQGNGSAATVGFDVDFGYGLQHFTLNLGNFGQSSGLTQFDGTNINVTSKVQDGSPAGTFKDVQINADGTVLANYDNGRQRTIAKVPIVLFNNPDALSRSTGNVFTETVDSGKARFNDTGVNGAGDIASSSLEGSNVDIASEFTQLIVAQRSYTANTKVITTADDLLQDTINLKR